MPNDFNLSDAEYGRLDEDTIRLLQRLLNSFINELLKTLNERKKRKRPQPSQYSPLQHARSEYHRQLALATKGIREAMPSTNLNLCQPSNAVPSTARIAPSASTPPSTPPTPRIVAQNKPPNSPNHSPRRQKTTALEPGQLTIPQLHGFAVRKSPNMLHTPLVTNPHKKAKVSKSVTPDATLRAAVSTPKSAPKNPYQKKAEKDHAVSNDFDSWDDEEEAVASAEQVDAATSLQFLARSTRPQAPPESSLSTNSTDDDNGTDNNEESQPLKSAEDGDYYSHLV